MKTPQRKPNVAMSNAELEEKIMQKYTKDNPQPRDLKEMVEQELNKLK